MKHVLYALLLCALFQGCGSSKSVLEKTDRRIMSDSLVEIKGNLERRIPPCCYAHTGKRKTGKSSGAIGRQHPGHCSGESLYRPA